MSSNPDMTGLPAGYPFKREYELTPREAAAMLAAGRLVLIDCRTQPEWDFTRVEGSALIPLHEIERRRDEVEAGAGQEVAVICHHGVRSMKAALALRALGVAGCRSVAGGTDAWHAGVSEGVKRYARSGDIITPIS